MECSQTCGFHMFDVFDTVPFIPFQPLEWTHPPIVHSLQGWVFKCGISLIPGSWGRRYQSPISPYNNLCGKEGVLVLRVHAPRSFWRSSCLLSLTFPPWRHLAGVDIERARPRARRLVVWNMICFFGRLLHGCVWLGLASSAMQKRLQTNYDVHSHKRCDNDVLCGKGGLLWFVYDVSISCY
jgi:hypothetical protein